MENVKKIFNFFSWGFNITYTHTYTFIFNMYSFKKMSVCLIFKIYDKQIKFFV